MAQKLPPHSIEAEQSVIGGLMLDPNSMDRVEGAVHADDFYKPAHRKIFLAIEELYRRNQPFDIVMVSNTLTDKGEFEAIGGADVLKEIYENAFSTVNIEAYANVIREKAQLRKVITTCKDILEEAYEPKEETVEEFMNGVESKIYALAEQKNDSGLLPASDVMKTSMERIEQLFSNSSEITGVPTGFVDLDKMTAGLQPQELVILAARPSMGKTAFSLNIAANAALRGNKKVAYFSLEMSKESLMFRILASESKIDMSKLRVGKIQDSAWSDLISTAAKVAEADFYIDDTSGISPFEILAKCRRLKNQHGLDLIMVDYLQLMSLKQRVESREREVSEISKTLKKIAKELNVCVVALAQLNRSVESRNDRRPMVSDLRESGSIEQDADVIMMIYREDYYEKENAENKGVAEIIVGKQRNGPVGTAKLAWMPNYGTFANLAPGSLQPPPPPTSGSGPSDDGIPDVPLSDGPPDAGGGLPNFAKR